MTDDEIKTHIDHAAEAGAKAALASIGLADENAGRDVGELRQLLISWRLARRTALATVVKTVTTAILMLLAIGTWTYIGTKH